MTRTGQVIIAILRIYYQRKEESIETILVWAL
jgi:hypothetical protein